MFGLIQLSQTVFFIHISGLRVGNTTLAEAKGKFYEYKSTSTVLDLYKSQFEELSGLIKSYSVFLAKDIELINKAGEELFRLDSEIGKSYN